MKDALLRYGWYGLSTAAALIWAFPGLAQQGSKTGDWRSYASELGYVYIATESPTNDGYGGHRPGANLYSDSLVCLDIKTGKMIWYKQLIHHDIWDYDMPAHPILIDFHAYDKKTGENIAEIPMPGNQTGVPMTYVYQNTQFILLQTLRPAHWRRPRSGTSRAPRRS